MRGGVAGSLLTVEGLDGFMSQLVRGGVAGSLLTVVDLECIT